MSLRMKITISLLLFVLLQSTSSLWGQSQLKKIINDTSPAVVLIASTNKNGDIISQGSGFIVGKEGIIVTNWHVIANSYGAKVKTLKGDIEAVSGVIAYDEQKDYAILKISGFDLPTIELANSNDVEIGDDVVAIGNPKGLEHTVTSGIISQRRRFEGYEMLQTDAVIASGSSGGPLLNMSGKAIGITTAGVADAQGLNFALPINYVRGALAENKTIKYQIYEISEWDKVKVTVTIDTDTKPRDSNLNSKKATFRPQFFIDLINGLGFNERDHGLGFGGKAGIVLKNNFSIGLLYLHFLGDDARNRTYLGGDFGLHFNYGNSLTTIGIAYGQVTHKWENFSGFGDELDFNFLQPSISLKIIVREHFVIGPELFLTVPNNTANSIVNDTILNAALVLGVNL